MKKPILAALLIGASLTSGCTAGAGVGDKAGGGGNAIVLRMANINGETGLSYIPAVQYFVDRVRALSGGQLRVQVVNRWGHEAVDAESQVVTGVSTGKADLGWVGTRVLDTRGVDTFQALTAPLLIDSYALENAVIRSHITQDMLKGLDSLHVSGLAVLADGLRKPIAVKPLLAPKDWNGINFASFRSREQEEAIQALGGQPSGVIGSTLNEALRTGKIQGLERNLLVYQRNGWESQVPYVTENVNLWPQMDLLLANPDTLDGLTTEQRGWLHSAATQAALHSTNLIEDEGQLVRNVCREGGRFVQASKGDLYGLRRAFAPVYRDLERDRQTKGFIDRITALKASVRGDPPLAIPSGCTGSAPKPKPSAPSDPLEGYWTSGRLTESQFVHAFIAAGGSEKEGHKRFGAQHFAVVTMHFQGGTFTAFTGADGKPAVFGEQMEYAYSDHHVVRLITAPACLRGIMQHYRLRGDTLTLHVEKQCPGGSGPDSPKVNAPIQQALYASFPFTRGNSYIRQYGFNRQDLLEHGLSSP